MNVTLSYRFYFESAHFMPNFPKGHPNARLHGHSYTAEVILEGPIDPYNGCVMEFEEIKALVKPIESLLDHTLLNELPGLNYPTSENIARFIYDELKPKIKLLKQVKVARESVGLCVHYPAEGIQNG